MPNKAKDTKEQVQVQEQQQQPKDEEEEEQAEDFFDDTATLKFCQSFKGRESQFSLYHPKRVTCPNCLNEVLPEVETKWDHEDTGRSKTFTECFCPCFGCFEREPETEDERDFRMSRYGPKIYIHICPKCKNRILYGYEGEIRNVYD